MSLVGVFAIATHLPYVVASDCLDSDAAVVTLMGRHFAHGQMLSPFLWGSRYMGALEAWALVPFAWVGLGRLAWACVAALCLSTIQVACVARIARYWRGDVFVAALLAAAPSALVAFSQTTLYGGRLAATTCSLLAVAILCGESSVRRTLLAGLFTGAAIAADHLMVIWAVPIALAAHRSGTLKCLVVAIAPWVVAERILYAITTGPKPGVADPWEWPRNIKLLLLDGVPMMFGVDWLGGGRSDFSPPAPSAVWVAASVVTVGFAVCAIAWFAKRMPERSCGGLVLVPLMAAALFVLAGYDIQSTRYLAPAWPSIAILAAVAAARRPALGLLGAAVATFNMALSVSGDLVHQHGAVAGRSCRATLVETAKAVTHAGVHGVWADYWDAYRLGLFMDEEMPFAPFAGVDRLHAWSDAVRQARPVGYLLGDGAPADLVQQLASSDKPIRIGSYTLYALPESLPAR
jgi:hypothetical protein